MVCQNIKYVIFIDLAFGLQIKSRAGNSRAMVAAALWER
jgi:hypothetical protein